MSDLILKSGEVYQGSDGAWRHVLRVGAAGTDEVDTSRMAHPDGLRDGDYDARCSSCWLNHAHSIDAHHLQIRRWES